MKAQKLGVIYARFSSDNQREESIEQQVAVCREFAADKGIEVIEIYADEAMSAKIGKGRTDRRPRFQQMRRAAEKGRFQYVIAYKSNRIYRNMLQALVFEEEVAKHGVSVLYVKEQFGDNAAGRFAFRTMLNVNQFYSENMAEDIRRNQAANAQQCRANGPAPFGYKSGADGRFEIDEPAAAVVREIFEKVARGEAFVDIARNLNDRGIKTRLGNAWGQNSFGAILKNERYTGVYIFDDTRIEGGMPAIISKEDFMAVQRKLATKKNPQGRHRENGDYLLTGKLYCGKCKEHMVGTSGTARNGTVHHYYSCTGKLAGACDCKTVKRDATELAIARAIRENVLKEDAIAWVADQVDAFQRQFKDSARLRELQQEQAENKKATDNVMSAIEQGIITATTRSRLLELEAAQAEISAKILAERSRTFRFTRDQVVTWLRSFSRRDVHDKEVQRQLFENFLIRAYLYDDGKVTLILNLFGDHSITIDFDPGTFDPDALSPDGSYNSFCGSPQPSHANQNSVILRFDRVFVLSFRL